MCALPNKPGEPEFQLKLDPEGAVTFKGKIKEEVIGVEIKITNNTKERQTFKVKCTDNEIFRVRPPLGFVKPDETVNIKISFQAKKEIKKEAKHYFAVYHMKCSDEKKTAREVWKADAKPEGIRRLGVVFEDTAGGAAEKKDDKKEEKKEEKADDKKEEKKDEDKKEDKKDEKEEKKDEK